jgi:hypothetical protein
MHTELYVIASRAKKEFRPTPFVCHELLRQKVSHVLHHCARARCRVRAGVKRTLEIRPVIGFHIQVSHTGTPLLDKLKELLGDVGAKVHGLEVIPPRELSVKVVVTHIL